MKTQANVDSIIAEIRSKIRGLEWQETKLAREKKKLFITVEELCRLRDEDSGEGNVAAPAAEWIDKHEAAKRLGIGWRRVLELAQKPDLQLQTQTRRHPQNRLPQVMFRAADVDRLSREREAARAQAAATEPAQPSDKTPEGRLAGTASADKATKKLTLEQKVLMVMRGEPGLVWSAQTVAPKIHAGPRSVQSVMSAMRRAGKIHKVPRGYLVVETKPL